MREQYEETMTLKDGTTIYFDYLERDSQGYHAIYAFLSEERSNFPYGGYLLWSDEGIVEFIQVGELYRRQGVAERLYDLACEKSGVQLQPSEQIENDGQLFVDGLKRKGKYQ